MRGRSVGQPGEPDGPSGQHQNGVLLPDISQWVPHVQYASGYRQKSVEHVVCACSAAKVAGHAGETARGTMQYGASPLILLQVPPAHWKTELQATSGAAPYSHSSAPVQPLPAAGALAGQVAT
jgi:hypothetical protein